MERTRPPRRLPATPRLAWVALVLLLLVSPRPAGAGDPPVTARLVVVLSGFHNDVGQARVNVFDREEGFPARHEQALRSASSPIRNGAARVVFEGLEPGTYAVSALHDENGDAIAQVNWLGIPTEGVGTSNDARGRLGPPAWDDAKFDLPAAERTVPVPIRY